MRYEVRDYRPSDEGSWLRCRVLSFLATAYFDNVLRRKPVMAPPGFSLVAVASDGSVAGALDVAVQGELATIETVAVHPDHQALGIGKALVDAARSRAVAAGATTLDAWTRDDPATLGWYAARGFAESEHYLHVFADSSSREDEPEDAVLPRPGIRPVTVFAHAGLEFEEEARKAFSRVHVCRRFSQPIGAGGPDGRGS
ncbi:GNAT family N-acetyltransferase [Streptomyces sp. PT12]|nr:GNAT family N-acetyltransferase [Streptomyces sp. PT12]